MKLRFNLAVMIMAGMPFNVLCADDPVKTVASRLSGEPLSSGYLIQLTVGLVVVLLAIVVLAWFARRFTHLQSSASGTLRVLGGLTMGSRERVVLIQVGETQLLLGVAPGRVQTLHVLDQPVEEKAGISGGPDDTGFAARLNTILQRQQK